MNLIIKIIKVIDSHLIPKVQKFNKKFVIIVFHICITKLLNYQHPFNFYIIKSEKKDLQFYLI